MVFKGRRLDDKLNPDVKVKEISKREMDIWSRLLTTLFDMPNDLREQLDKLLLTWLKKGLKKGARFYLAYVKGKPVGTCTLFSLERSGGIFNVGTLKEYRRRGVGTTLTLTAVSDSINEGNGFIHCRPPKEEMQNDSTGKLGLSLTTHFPGLPRNSEAPNL